MKTLVWGVLCLAAAVLAAPAEGATPRRYDLDVDIDPARRHVAVAGRVSVGLAEGETRFSFDLHETFRIAECAVDGTTARCFPREASTGTTGISRRVTVQVPDAVFGEQVDLEIRYEGTLRDRPGWGQPDAEGPFMDDAAGPDRVELALFIGRRFSAPRPGVALRRE